MRIKVIGECDCARALRGLLRQAGFAVVEFLPREAILEGPIAGFVVAIEESAAADHIAFDSTDSPLEANILRHVAQLSPRPVLVDRPGGQVHSDREIRIVVPRDDPAQASAVEFGVLRGLLDTVGGASPALRSFSAGGPKKTPWWRRAVQRLWAAARRALQRLCAVGRCLFAALALAALALALPTCCHSEGPRPVGAPKSLSSAKEGFFGLPRVARGLAQNDKGRRLAAAGPQPLLIRAVGAEGAALRLALDPRVPLFAGQFQAATNQSNIAFIGGSTVSANLYDAGNTALKVNCVVGCSASAGFTDNSAFTAGSTAVNNIAAVFNDSIAALTSGNSGALRATSDRMLFVNLGKLGGTALSGANVVDAANSAFKVNCVTGCSASAGFTDNSAFTAGSTAETNIGGVYNDSLAAVTSGNAAAARITAQRAWHVNLRNASGGELGVASAPLEISLANTGANATAVKVDGSAVTQPVSGTVTANAGTGTFAVGGTVTVTQATAANLNATVTGTVNAAQSGAWGVTANQGTAAALAGAWPAKITDGTNTMPAGDAAARGLYTRLTDGTDTLALGASTSTPTWVLCDSSAAISTATAGDTQLVALVSGKTVYVCGYNFMAAGAVNAQLEYGTGTACGTGKTALTGAYPLTAQTGVAYGNGQAVVTKTAASNALCINLSAAVQVSGIVTYTQF